MWFDFNPFAFVIPALIVGALLGLGGMYAAEFIFAHVSIAVH